MIKNIYFVNAGDRVGQFLAIIDFDDKTNNYDVLGLPECEALIISKKDIDLAIKNNVLSFVHTLPKDIFLSTKNEYLYRKNNK